MSGRARVVAAIGMQRIRSNRSEAAEARPVNVLQPGRFAFMHSARKTRAKRIGPAGGRMSAAIVFAA